ncbi:hypothetical protein DFP74_2254 [Nocardiopsis sp. Huas11]|nr:hypothetical protein DFP74_2254 [Nocardiopsis sp. Huas11]
MSVIHALRGGCAGTGRFTRCGPPRVVSGELSTGSGDNRCGRGGSGTGLSGAAPGSAGPAPTSLFAAERPARGPLLPCPHPGAAPRPPPSPAASYTPRTRTCGQSCAQTLCPGSRALRGGAEKSFQVSWPSYPQEGPGFCGKPCGQPVDNGSEVVGNPVRSVDGSMSGRSARPGAPVENLGKTCGRSCGRSVDKLWGPRAVHRHPELRTGSSTSTVDKNSGVDLVKRWLSTLSTAPTTTTHLH